MTSDFLNAIAPKTNFWSPIFLRSDSLEKIEENALKEKTSKLYDDITNNGELLLKVEKRLKKRHYELWKYSNSFWANTIFFRFFSPYSPSELAKRRIFLATILKGISEDYNLDFSKKNKPLEYLFPQLFYTTEEMLKAKSVKLISTPQGCETQWYDEHLDEFRTAKTPTCASLKTFLNALYYSRNLQDSLPPHAAQMIVLIRTIDDLSELPHNPPEQIIYSQNEKLYIDYDLRYCYFGANNEFVTGLIVPNENTYQTLTSYLELLAGYKQKTEFLNENYSSFLVDQMPIDGELPVDKLDIRIYIPSYKRNNFMLCIPSKNGFEVHEMFDKDFKYLENFILSRFKATLDEKGVTFPHPDQESDLSAYSQKPYITNSEFPLHLRKCQIHPTGFETLDCEIKRQKMTVADLGKLLELKVFSQDEIALWNKQSSLFKDDVRSEGLLYDTHSPLNNECRIQFYEDAKCPVPIVRYIWKDNQGEVHTLPITEFNTDVIDKAGAIEKSLRLSARLELHKLKEVKSTIVISFELVLGTNNLKIVCPGFTKCKDNYSTYFIHLSEDDTFDTVGEKILQQARLHKGKLSALLDGTAAETGVINTPISLLQNSSNDEGYLSRVATYKHSTYIHEKIESVAHFLHQGPFVRSIFLKEYLLSDKEFLVQYNTLTMSYKAYFPNPLFPTMLMQIDLNTADDLLKLYPEEILHSYKLSTEGFLGKLSSFRSVKIPEKKEVDIEIIRAFYNTANFSDKKSPNYADPNKGDINLTHTAIPKLLDQFYADIYKPTNRHILQILTNIIFEIHKIDDLREKMLYAIETAAAMCFCPTKHESAFTTIYQTLIGDGEQGNVETYDYYQRELAEGDKLKRGAVIEMAAEVLDPFETSAEVVVNNQSVHSEKHIITHLHKIGILIPFSDIHTEREENYNYLGNFRTEKEVIDGFLNKLNTPHILRFYNERHNNAVKNADLHALDSMWTMLLEYVETHMLPLEKYDVQQDKIKEIQEQKKNNLKALKETEFSVREKMSRKLQAEALANAKILLEKTLVGKPWIIEEVLKAIKVMQQWALKGSKDTEKALALQKCELPLRALLDRTKDAAEVEFLTTAVDTYICSIKSLVNTWRAYRKAQINHIEAKAKHDKIALLESILYEQDFVVCDEDFNLQEVTLEGSAAILVAMNFFEET